MINLRKCLFLVVGTALSIPAHGQDTNGSVLATVNGESLYKESVALITNTIEKTAELSSDEILEELINLRLLSQAAREMKLHENSKISLAIELQIDQTLANAYTAFFTNGIDVSDEELKSQYSVHVKRLEKQDYRSSHIQFETFEDATSTMAKLANGADFAELAKALSVSPDGSNGGDLGWNPYGLEAYERSDEVEELEVGQISEPLQTSFGWHIFKLTDTRGATIPSYESIKDELETIVVRTKLKEHLDTLRSKAEVEISSK